MDTTSNNVFVGFRDFFQALSSSKVIRTKSGDLSISGNVISSKDFNSLYMQDIISMLTKYESTISPEFAPSKDLYQTLDVLSSPVLKGTSVPEAVTGFCKKLNIAISSKEENRKTFETDLKDYVQNANETPVFMLTTLDKQIDTPSESPSPIKSLIPDSSTLMDGYGTKYNGEDILDLAEDGYIEAKAPINMLIYKSLDAQDEKSPDYIKPVSYNQLLDFYSPEKHPGRLHTIMKNDEIDRNFSDLHGELLDNVSKKEKKDYLQDIVDETKTLATTPADYSNDLLTYANTQIIPDKTLSGNITPEFLKTKFKAGEISLARIIDIYESDQKYFKPLETILTPVEIEKAHSKNELEDHALMYLPENSRASYLQKNKAKLSTIMYLFLNCDGISITELQKLLISNGSLAPLDFYIDSGSHPSRIKELYENYLIDYGCIKNLVTSGLLSETELKKYNLVIPKEPVYTEIQNAPEIKITGSSHTVPVLTTGNFIGPQSQTKKTNEKATALYRILGNISEDDNINMPTISHFDEKRKKGFLDGYRLLPLQPSGLVVLLPKEPAKPTYMMPYQETAFILRNKRLPDSFPENPVIQEVKPTEKMHEDILKTAYQFEDSKNYLDKLGYSEDLNFDEAIRIMTEEYIKIRTKGEN